MNRVTISQVAKHARVSNQTVSRVLNDKSEVADETRSRVLASIKTLNYYPSQAARALSRQRTSVIGIVIPWEPDFLFTDYHLLSILHGIDRELNVHDYNLLLCTPRSLQSPISGYERLLKERMVDGVIVDATYGLTGAELLAEKGYPVVVVGYCSDEFPCVHPDDEGGAYNLAQHLIALGHRRIGVIGGPEPARWRGFESACRDAGLEQDPDLITHGNHTLRSGYEAVPMLMQQSHPPSAIYAFNDKMAIGAMRWLKEHGYSIPEAISVVGFDDMPSADFIDIPLTTVNLCSEDIGQRAASLLLRIIEGNTPQKKEIELPTRLMIRQSTAMTGVARRE